MNLVSLPRELYSVRLKRMQCSKAITQATWYAMFWMYNCIKFFCYSASTSLAIFSHFGGWKVLTA